MMYNFLNGLFSVEIFPHLVPAYTRTFLEELKNMAALKTN